MIHRCQIKVNQEEFFMKCVAINGVKSLEVKEIDVMKFVTGTVSLEETRKAFEDLTSGVGTDIKILIDSAK